MYIKRTILTETNRQEPQQNGRKNERTKKKLLYNSNRNIIDTTTLGCYT